MRYFSVRSPGSDVLADALFIPTQGAMPTQGVTRVRYTFWVNGDGIRVAPGIQYDNDGVDWTLDPGIVASFIDEVETDVWEPLDWLTPESNQDPTHDRQVLTGWVDAPTGFLGLDGTPRDNDRLFFRPGFFILNVSDDGVTKGGQVAMAIEVEHIESGTTTSQMVLCCSGGGNGTTPTAVITPITEGLPTNGAGSVRLTLETTATDGATVTLRYQTSVDNRNWGDTGYSFSATPTLSYDGIAYQTEFMAFSPSNALYWRVCAHVVNTTSSDTQIRSAQVRARVDWREG